MHRRAVLSVLLYGGLPSIGLAGLSAVWNPGHVVASVSLVGMILTDGILGYYALARTTFSDPEE